ncbi:hypothetical protein PENSPDRAFT_147238 [Peniophora sp. CONT]|nr:hypothetical protein PENSPDRAFT_147238 [Peniophora sp. CONT]
MAVYSTLGAALAGGMVAVALSALVCFQTFLYYLIFPQDTRAYKLLVGWIWLSDSAHTILVCASVWFYTISNFNNPDIVSRIFNPVAINVTLTGFITLSVNAFYGYRIHRLSKSNWWITGPIIFLSVARVGMGLTTTVMMIREGSFPAFAAKFKILFTTGLILSAVTDIYVSVARYWYLRNLRDGYVVTQEMVDTTVVFTINDGMLTCLVVIASIACWLGMPHNFVYLGIYFTIAKLYSNSLLATLNLRNWFRHRYNLPRRQQLGLVMTRSGRVSGYPLANNANTPHLQSHTAQSIDKDIDADRASPDRLEVIVDTTHHVAYDQELQLFGARNSGGDEKVHTFPPTTSNAV